MAVVEKEGQKKSESGISYRDVRVQLFLYKNPPMLWFEQFEPRLVDCKALTTDE